MLSQLLHALLPHPVLAVILAVAGAAFAGTVGVSYAAKRTLAQPLLMALAEETTVLAGTLTSLRRYPFLSTIEPLAFSAHHHHNIWAALRDVLGDHAEYPETATDTELGAAGATLQARSAEILAAVRHHLATRSVSPASDLARFDELLTYGHERGFADPEGAPGVAQIDADVISAAESVIYAAGDRTDRGGLGLVVPGVDPNSLDPDNPPLVREQTPMSTLRRTVTAGSGAILGLLIPGFATLTGLEGAALLAAAVALIALAAGSVVISLVDLDTMFIDYRSWGVATGAAWTAATAAALLAGQPSRLMYGVLLVIAIVALLEGANFLFRVIRGQHGQGFGDTYIIVLTAGIPPALVGDWRVGYWAVLAGTLVAALGWIVMRLAGRTKASAAFAFGPWLACGWVLAMIWFAYDALAIGALV